MPKTRPYTREELQGLRRADLQRLCKTYDIKGANAKSDVLIETLAKYFTSPAYLASPRPSPRARPHSRVNLPPRPLNSIAGRHPKFRIGVTSSSQSKPPQRARLEADHTIPETVAPESSHAAPIDRLPPSDRGLELATLRQEVSQLKEIVVKLEEFQSGVSTEILEAKIDERLHSTFRRQLAVFERREADLQKREKELDVAWETFRCSLAAVENRILDLSSHSQSINLGTLIPPDRVPRINSESSPKTSGASTFTSSLLRGKRKQLIPAEGRYVGNAEDAQLDIKRARLHGIIPNACDEVELAEDYPDRPEIITGGSEGNHPQFTLQAPSSSTHSERVDDGVTIPSPRTPSPSHQGVLVDQSRTPSVHTDFFAHPSPSYGSSRTRIQSADHLPYPIFATTPRPPFEQSSPTIDKSDHRFNTPRLDIGVSASILTPGGVGVSRRQPGTASRKVSKAHLDLTSITESSGDPRRRDESPLPDPKASSSSLFGPVLPRDRTVTPPALSPSPSIGGDNFTYTPLPLPSARPSYLPYARRADIIEQSKLPRLSGDSHGTRAGSTPAREYMDVAINGFTNPDDSPSALATPSHRTLLGTERYRDTRFGDEPVLPWSTPRADFGYPPTPSQ